MGRQALPLIVCVVVWRKERYPPSPSPLTTCGRWHIWLCAHESRLGPSPAAALGRAGPAPCLGRTVELTQLAGSWCAGLKGENMGQLAPLLVCPEVAQVRERCLPTPHPFIPFHQWQAGELTLRSSEWEAIPAPHLLQRA